MTTVADVLNFALKDSGVLGEGDTASAETFSDAYQTLLQMLALWQTDNMYVYAQADTSFAANGGTTYTVGTSGNFAVLRPPKIDYCYWSSGGIDYPVTLLSSFEEYENIPQKTQAGQPMYAFYNPTYTLGTLYVYPQPTTGTLHIGTQAEFPALATTAATLALPPEYVLPIRTSLAEILIGMFGLPLNQGLASVAASSRKLLKRKNVRIPELGMPLGLQRYRRSRIISG
jgi:hypothetical protein